MRKLILAIVPLCSCVFFQAHVRPARFVDGSEAQTKAAVCIPDDSTTNPGGFKCADEQAVRAMQHMLGLDQLPDDPAPAKPPAQL